MTRAEQYRLRAKDAEQCAKESRDSDAKRTFLEIAKNWRDMADQAERHGL